MERLRVKFHVDGFGKGLMSLERTSPTTLHPETVLQSRCQGHLEAR